VVPKVSWAVQSGIAAFFDPKAYELRRIFGELVKGLTSLLKESGKKASKIGDFETEWIRDKAASRELGLIFLISRMSD
jgi:hypothetical protein